MENFVYNESRTNILPLSIFVADGSWLMAKNSKIIQQKN